MLHAMPVNMKRYDLLIIKEREREREREEERGKCNILIESAGTRSRMR